MISSTQFRPQIPQDFIFPSIRNSRTSPRVRREDNTLHVIPIKVMISKKHKDSEALFYNKWESRFPGIKLYSTFIWIVEVTKSTKGEVRDTRTTKQVESRDHVQVYLSAEDVQKPLVEASN